MRHIRKMIVGSTLFLVVTLLTLKISATVTQVEGFIAALEHKGTLQMLLTNATVLGGITGLMSSIIFRKSTNYQTYCWISAILILICTELVIIGISAR